MPGTYIHIDVDPLGLLRGHTSPSDRRYARRFPHGVVVELEGEHRQRAVTFDVSRTGLCIRSPDPAPLRHVVRAVIHAPAGIIRLMVSVARHIFEGGVVVGAGLRILAPAGEAYQAWLSFVVSVAQAPQPTTAAHVTPGAHAPQVAPLVGVPRARGGEYSYVSPRSEAFGEPIEVTLDLDEPDDDDGTPGELIDPERH